MASNKRSQVFASGSRKPEAPSMEMPNKGKAKGKQESVAAKGSKATSKRSPSSLASSLCASPTSSPPTQQPFTSKSSMHTSQIKPGPKGKVRPVLQKPKRLGAALMYIVSYGTPQKLLPSAGMCHRVSPHPKKLKELQPSQIGIKHCARIGCPTQAKEFGNKQLEFLKDISNLEVVQAMIRNAVDEAMAKVDEAMAKESKRQFFLEDIDRGVALRSLMAEWKKTADGKDALKHMMEAINHSYERMQKETSGCHHRRVQEGDVLVELKHLIKGTNNEVFLQAASNAISLSSGLPGEKFLELIQSYVSTNKQVHPVWTHDKLQRLVDLVKQGELQVGGTWVLKMAVDIAKDHHWKLVV